MNKYINKTVDKIIKIYCNERKEIWFKNIDDCTAIIKNPNTYIIYSKDKQQKVLSGVDLVGNDLYKKPCLNIENAKSLVYFDKKFKTNRYIFYEAFDNCSNYNGYEMRYNKGVSGTHTSIIYLAEALAKNNEVNEVIIVSLNNLIIETTYNNVKYINFCNLKQINCDFLIHPNHVDIKILTKVNTIKNIVICHNEPSKDFNKLNKDDVIINYFTNCNKKYFVPDGYDNFKLPNSIDISNLQEIDIKNKKNQFCFFACDERGCGLVENIIKYFPNFSLKTSFYSGENGLGKFDIYKILSESKYFIYPLINLENNRIHYDTFGYVVLEALLHGVIVICPKTNSLYELFGDSICYIDTEGIIPENDLCRFHVVNKNFGYPLVKKYVEKINFLEKNENIKNEYIYKGLALKENFCNHKISKIFLDNCKNNISI
jgi:glycosyltransferase involved in cell wall biosynthesis